MELKNSVLALKR